MEPDEEPEPGSSSQNQNLQDLQNYLVTFNKDISGGDDVLPNMDVDTSVGDVGDLYGPTSENSLQEAGDSGVSSQFSSGFYSEQGMLDTTLSDEPSHQIQNLVGSSSGDGDTEMNDIKPEVSSLDLEGVSAQIAGFADGQLSHAIPGIQAGSLSQGLIMAPLGDNQGKVLRILSFGGEDGQFLMADGQQMQVINSEDLGLTADGLVDTGEVSLDINSTSSLIASGNVDSPMSLPSLHTSTVDTANTSGIAITQAHSSASSTSLITTTSGSETAILNPSLGQLVTLQGAVEGGQSQLVSLQGEAIQADDLQMPNLLGGEAVNAELGYQTITILPSDLTQHGEMNYVLILSQPGGGRDSVASVAQVYDLKQENQDFSEELMDENGDSKKALRFMPKKMVNQIGHQQLMCAFCNYTSPKRYLLTRHMRSHSDERPFKCESCDRGFKTSASLLNHVNTHTGTRPHKCKTCEAAFTTSGELVRHIRYRHTFEKPHRCPECDYASVELSKLKRHMRSHTGERPYKCPYCPYASPDTYKLKRHMRIHTGEKPYECDHCHARFTQSNSLKAHKLIHTGNKPVYQCTLCPTTCGRKTDLKIHFNKLHSTGLPLECRKCGKTYSDRYSYKQHLRTHDVEKCYKCENCNFIAANEKSLQAHTMGRCGGKARCDECHMTFTSQKQFDRHMVLAHPNSQTSKKVDSDEKILDEDDEDEPGVSAADKRCEEKVTPLLASEGHGGDTDESDGSQVIITPLASDTLHKNLIQDIKEGKLGDVPQVVIVHPDGSQEEISSKLATDKWNVEDNLVPIPASEESARLDNIILTSRAQEMSSSLSGDTIAPVTTRDGLFMASKDRESLSCQEGQLFNQSESSQHCEAATQVEIESDADSSCDTTSLDNAPRQKGETEESTEHLTKVLQENSGSLFNMDSSVKSSLVVPDLTPAIKTSTSSSSLYLKTLINKSSGVQSMTSLSSPQLQSQPSVVKVVPATSVLPVSTGSSRSQQYSLFSSSIPSVSASNAKTSNSSSADKDFIPKGYVSLSGLSRYRSKPPTQLMAGDALYLPLESGHSDTIGMLGLDELPSSSEQIQGRLDLEMEDSDSCIDIKDLKAVEHKTLSALPPLHGEPNEQNIKCNLSTSLTNEDSTSSHSGQSTLQAVNSLLKGNSSMKPTVMRQSDESQPPNFEPNLDSDSAVQPCSTSFLDHETDSPAGPEASTLVDQSLYPHGSEVPPFESIQISLSDVDSESKQHSCSITKPYSQPPDQPPPKVHESPLISEKSHCDNSGEKAEPGPISVLSNSPQSEKQSIASCESKEAAPSSSADVSKQSWKNTTKDIGNVETTKIQGADLQPTSQSKSARSKSSKRKIETDQTLVMTGKRQRKALVKVSL